jgi:hypothetical protein
MLSGALRVGARTPVGGAPAWATLEVVHGGFTTGELLAGGPLQPHEEALLAKLPGDRGGTDRAALNSYYLGDKGLAELRQMLSSGCYRVNVPEEGALLVVAWLLEHDRLDHVTAVLDEIGPFLARLRFYPVPDPHPLAVGSLVHLQDVGQTVKDLEAVRARPRYLTQREALQVWAPLADRVVALFLETVKGDVPTLRTGPDGKVLRSAAGHFAVEGGWPCQHFPDGWQARATAALEDYRRLRAQHGRCGKPEDPTQNFARLRGHLETCTQDPRRLSGKDVGVIRLILAAIVTRRGTPDSPRCRQLREFQAAQAAGPTRADYARLLVGRLAGLPRGDGVADLDPFLAPVTAEEAARHNLKAGTPIPDSLGRVARRCLDAPIPALVELGVVPSAEVLAKVIPTITAQVRAAGIPHPDLRRLFGAIYTAFRRRRSLLLLNLESQVKLEELPWVRALDAFRKVDLPARWAAEQTLEQVVVTAVTGFPEQILPNKLLQELRTLAASGGLQLPLVEEVAADIFMGEFSEKFLRAAQQAAQLLRGRLYEQYYGISYDQVIQINDVKPSRFGAPTTAAFAQLCARLAEPDSPGGRWSPARNGKVIEQEQILTTHNLAVLVGGLRLVETLRPRLEELARRCFKWVCRSQQQKIEGWQARLQMIKNTAYAWRQMVFFLSLLLGDVVWKFFAWASEHLTEQDEAFQKRFAPALNGLMRAAQGRSAEEPPEGRRFLGWTTEKHWLLE